MDEEFSKIEILVKGDDDQMVKMLEYIRSISVIGHSFDIVVDPDLREYKKSFYADGDGSFFIKSVKKNGIKVKTDKEGKLIESYLNKLYQKR